MLDLKKTVGYGVALWALIFVIVSAFVGFKMYDVPGIELVVALIGGVIAYVLAGYAKPKNTVQAIAFGASWVLVGIILDALVTMKFNPLIFQSIYLWLGYALVILAPALRVKKQA